MVLTKSLGFWGLRSFGRAFKALQRRGVGLLESSGLKGNSEAIPSLKPQARSYVSCSLNSKYHPS